MGLGLRIMKAARKKDPVADYLDEAIQNSEPWRHSLICTKCGQVIRAATPIGVRLAMRVHRNRKCRKNVRKAEVMSTAQEMGARLQAIGDEVLKTMNARRTAISEDMNAMLEQMSGCKQTIEKPTDEVARMLGENHRGMTAIINSTSEVDERLDQIYRAALLVVRELETLPSAVDTLAITYMNVGAAIAGGNL